MSDERLQELVNNVRDQCPNMGPIACFMDEKRAILQIHFRYDSEPIPDKEEDDDPMDHGYNHMFLHALDLQESDWTAHEKDIIDRYNRYMQNPSD